MSEAAWERQNNILIVNPLQSIYCFRKSSDGNETGWESPFMHTRKPSGIQMVTYLKCLFGNGIFLQAGDHFQHCHHVMDLQQGRKSHFMFHVHLNYQMYFKTFHFIIAGNINHKIAITLSGFRELIVRRTGTRTLSWPSWKLKEL